MSIRMSLGVGSLGLQLLDNNAWECSFRDCNGQHGSLTADLLVGCDGIGSTVLTFLYENFAGKSKPTASHSVPAPLGLRDCGITAYWGCTIVGDKLPRNYAFAQRDRHFYFGGGTLTTSSRPENVLYWAAFIKTSAWKSQLSSISSLQGEYSPQKELANILSKRNKYRETESSFRDENKGWNIVAVNSLLQQLNDGNQRVTKKEIRDRKVLARYAFTEYTDNGWCGVALVGDSAHACTPFMGEASRQRALQ